ncbi:MAG: PspC domain-containing protein [Elusimicrobiota bacterium]
MKQLFRLPNEKMIAGVCAGFAKAFSWNVTVVRLACVFLFFIGGFFPIIFLYVIAWIIMPVEKTEEKKKDDTIDV